MEMIIIICIESIIISSSPENMDLDFQIVKISINSKKHIINISTKEDITNQNFIIHLKIIISIPNSIEDHKPNKNIW